jgi:hypothetical protein
VSEPDGSPDAAYAASTLTSPYLSITPDLFSVGKTSAASLCITNSNKGSKPNIESGDKFALLFYAELGPVSSFKSGVLVNSTTLFPTDFKKTLTSNKVTLTYIGDTHPFPPGDSFCVEVNLDAPAAIGFGMVQFGAPTDAAGKRSLFPCTLPSPW